MFTRSELKKRFDALTQPFQTKAQRYGALGLVYAGMLALAMDDPATCLYLMAGSVSIAGTQYRHKEEGSRENPKTPQSPAAPQPDR